MNCPYCGNEAEFMSTKEFYGKDYGANMYVCKPCDAYVGTHGKSKTPLGTMANKETREWRKRTHQLFDPIWRKRKMSRSNAYKWMEDTLGLSSEDAHIGKFDVEKCKKLIYEVKKFRGLN